MVALGDNDPIYEEEYNKLGTTAGAYDDWHEGMDPAGITTQDPDLIKRFDPNEGGRRLMNYLKVMTLEAQTWCWGFGWGDEVIPAKTRSMMNLSMIQFWYWSWPNANDGSGSCFGR